MNEARQPSIFELLACDKLKDGLREAFRYLLENLSYYDTYKRLPLPPIDELVLALDLLIEYNHLKAYNASYAENLYQLVRYERKTNGIIQQVLPSLFCLTVIPYINRKVEKYFEELNYKDSRTADEVRRIRIYRLINHSSSFLNLIGLLRYAGGRSKYHNTLNILTGISLRGRLERGDDNGNVGFKLTSKTIADFMGRALTVGSYVIQFLDYWNTHSNSTPLFSASLKVPEPPNRDDLAYTDDGSSSICLICSHVRQNECTLSNTGYVFCYSCIYKYVKSKQKCPITGHPATVDNIVKLFTSSAPS
uniref:Peroxisome assembly protein 12 n=1 Tax=Aceria tosichella TaxID=561515 RepID=A0A6G1SLW8_9ACAR